MRAKQFLTCCISIKKGDERDGRNQETQVSSSIQDARFTILDFPASILLEILARLPVKSIVICRCVCKKFSGLISDPYFHNAYRIKQPFAAIFVSGKAKGLLYLLEVGDPQKLTQLQVKKNMPQSNGVVRYVASCNGLICVSVYYSIRGFLHQVMVHICNPILGEYVTLPEIKESFFNEWFGFGLNPSTNQFKVVRIVHHSLPNEDYVRASTTVFTIGVDVKWRILKHANCEYLLERHGSGPVFQGAIHWLPVSEGPILWLREPYGLGRRTYDVIIAFDLDEENFRSIPAPGDMISKIRACSVRCSIIRKLVVLRNCLSIICYTDEFNIWTMRQYGVVDSWSKSYSIRDSLLSGYYLDSSSFIVLPTPASVWGDGEIFILSSKTGLISYNLEEGKKCTEVKCDDMKSIDILNGDTYIPSLISLKNLFPGGQASVLSVKQNREQFSTT